MGELRRSSRSFVLRVTCGLTVAAVLSAFAVLLITGSYTDEGRVLFVLVPGHGVHVGDLFVMGAWTIGMVALAVSTLKKS